MQDQEVNEFAELQSTVKAKGFMGLDSKEKRDRYRELKAEFDNENEEVRGLTKKDIKDLLKEEIERYKSELVVNGQMPDGFDEAMTIGKWIKQSKPAPQNRRAKLRVYREDGLSEGGIVIDSRLIRYEYNQQTGDRKDPIYQITVLYNDDSEKKYEIRLVDLIEGQEYEEVEIVKELRDKVQMSQGKGRSSVRKDGYFLSNPGMFQTKGANSGDEFDFVVTADDVMLELKRKNGKTLKLHSSKLN